MVTAAFVIMLIRYLEGGSNMSIFKKLLGLIRKALNAANKAGYIPSENPSVPTGNLGNPHDPRFPEGK